MLGIDYWLTWAEFSRRTATLSAGIAVSLATGGPKSVQDQINAATNTVLNYAANNGLDRFVGHRTATGGTLQNAIGTKGGGGAFDNILGSISTQLTGFGLVNVGPGGMLEPALIHAALSKTRKELAGRGAGILTSAVINSFSD